MVAAASVVTGIAHILLSLAFAGAGGRRGRRAGVCRAFASLMGSLLLVPYGTRAAR